MSTHSRHLQATDQWSVYEANVQSYRNMAMSSQSLYLTAGAIFLGNHESVALFAIMTLALVTQWFIWFPVIFSRTAIVDFHKFNLGERFNADGLKRANAEDAQLDERKYANTRAHALRKTVYAGMIELGYKDFRTMRMSRTKIDFYLPLMLTTLWIVFAVIEISHLVR